MIEPVYKSNLCTVYHGDCLAVLPQLEAGAFDAVISDPPYGMNANLNSKRYTGGNRALGRGEGRDDWPAIHGDNKPFDPSPWLEFPRVVLWGYHHFARRLPVGTVLVWLKRNDTHFGTFLSDCELAWMKGGHGVYAHRKLFPPPSRSAEGNGKCLHPTQKPVGLMAWCMEKAKVPTCGRVLDPYAGSGTTGIACIRSGRSCVLIEKEAKYVELAIRRVKEAEGVGSLFEPQAVT